MRTTSESARDFQVFISGDTDSGTDPATVSLNANTVLHGAIYAPDASITLPAGFELFGSLIARSLNFGDDAPCTSTSHCSTSPTRRPSPSRRSSGVRSQQTSTPPRARLAPEPHLDLEHRASGCRLQASGARRNHSAEFP